MAGKRKLNPGRSTNPLRADVLRVLGVLKVATADQIQRLALPHLTYRHTSKETEAKRKEARTASHRAALADLRKHGLVLDGGSTKDNETLRGLTPMGLEAAAVELGRPMDAMGGIARGAGRTGASHPMAVNEAVLALIRPKPDLGLLDGEPADAVAAAEREVAGPPGIGSIGSYATEVPLPSTGTWSTAGKGGAQADIVLVASEDGIPLMFIEVDNCFETAQEIAAKFDKYMRFLRRRIKDTDGREKAMWRTRWSAPSDRHGETLHPPVLLVFNQIGPRNAQNTMRQLAELTRQHWQGHPQRDHHTYDGKIPIVATTLDLLREHGPAGEVFWRFGRTGLQPLLAAVGNPRQVAAEAKAEARRNADDGAREAERQRELAERAAARERERPSCTECGAKFTDARWRRVNAQGWDTEAEPHPTLCDDCKDTLANNRLHGVAEKNQTKEAAAEHKGRGLLSRLRP
ncbi:replication-relaxation family protein [Streptomyces sp. ISL-43]|uniref:replication-relaxation family protein n=1 Tax=Streptomyces sp. ISL-43 TaxID=2819183 RepID=UPI001BEB8202|nr:replication-relaxation family protein [Streptomyces sp. ISL-43]MBT2446023.1 replication-relaxation family protein [Streptomyces sp. ISL-43]